MHLITCVCSRASTCLRMRKSVSLCVYAPTCVRPRVCVCPDLSTNLMLRHHLIISKDNIRGHCHINEPCTRCYYPCPRISVVFTHHLITHPYPLPHFVVYLCFDLCPADPVTTAVVASGVVVILIVILVIVIFVISVRKPRERQSMAAPSATVRRMNTPVATVAEETSITVPTATETGIRSALTADADMVMPSVSSAENFANVPIATAAPATEPANMTVATARSAAE